MTTFENFANVSSRSNTHDYISFCELYRKDKVQYVVNAWQHQVTYVATHGGEWSVLAIKLVKDPASIFFVPIIDFTGCNIVFKFAQIL